MYFNIYSIRQESQTKPKYLYTIKNQKRTTILKEMFILILMAP